MAAQSKMSVIYCTCQDFQHNWTDKCVNATAGLLLASTPYCLRVYTMVYVLSMVMRHKIPTKQELRKMILGILQSTAFLVTNAYTFILYNCLIRNLIGRYYVSTVAFIPCYLASLSAIAVERPQRRPLLTLYVANVATETLWNMAEARGLVKSIPKGQVLIFGASISALLYLYRKGLHKTNCKDSLFDIMRIFVGKSEEGNAISMDSGLDENATTSTSTSTQTNTPPAARCRPPVNFHTIQGLIRVYTQLIKKLKSKHVSCPHKNGCVHYALMGGLRPLIGGMGLQVALKLIMNIKRIAQNKVDWQKTLFNRQTMNLGLFLGSFSFLFKSVSCSLRHVLNRDDPRYAIPASLIGSIGFLYYPDTTVALYVMWKTLQILYNLGIEKNVVPKIPGFTIMFYAFCTSVLFHAGILEPRTLRPSYYKFLQAISGERFSKFNMVPLDAFGLDSSQGTADVLKRLNIVDKTPFPKFALADW